MSSLSSSHRTGKSSKSITSTTKSSKHTSLVYSTSSHTNTNPASSSSKTTAANGPLRFSGCAGFRQRIVLATLCNKRIRIDNIRDKEEYPGLRPFEASFLRLIESLTNGCHIEINETGTSLKYAPGIIIGGNGIEHDCGTTRSIGWFIEGILPLLPFGKKATEITFTGITNDDVDLSIDTLRVIHLPLLEYFGIKDGLNLALNGRGSAPLGGGSATLTCPNVRELRPVNLIDEGYIKRIRGVAFTSRVSPQNANRIVDGARGLLNSFLPDVYIYTDHTKGDTSGKSPGYGISLIATSTSGCVYGSQKISGKAIGALNPTVVSSTNDNTLMVPEDMGKEAAGLLLNEISRGGCIDSTAQSLVFTLMVLCPEDVSRVRIGELSVAGIATLRLLREFFGVIFKLQPDNQRNNTKTEDEPSRKHKKSRTNVDDESDDDSENDDGDEDDEEEDVKEKKRKRKQKPSFSSKNDIIDYDNPSGKNEPVPEVPLTSSITGGHSGKTILVSCLGIGYKNYAKKVT